MKKILSLALAGLMVISILCVYGGSSEAAAAESTEHNAEITQEDVVGEWYDLKTAQKILLNSNGSNEIWKGSSSDTAGSWELKDGFVSSTNIDLREKLQVIENNGIISLVGDTLCFYRWADLPKSILTIGETGTDGSISLTLEGVAFSELLPEAVTSSNAYKSWGNKDEFALSSGMVYVIASISVTNMTKNAITIADNKNFNMILDYNDGFQYSTLDQTAVYYISGSDVSILYNKGGTNVGMTLQPLETKNIGIIIPCASIIASDAEAPLFISFISNYGTEASYFEANLR